MKYLDCLPTFEIGRLKKLISYDIDACKHMAIDIKKSMVDSVVANYNEFVKQQQKQLEAFIFK